DRVSVAEHDVIGARAAVDRLVEVVAHGIGVSEMLEIRSVAVLNVVEGHGGGTFASCRCRGRVLGTEVGGVLQAVGAGAHRHFHPREQLGIATGWISFGSV